MQTQSRHQIEENGYRNGPYISGVTDAILPQNFLEISNTQNMSNCNSIGRQILVDILTISAAKHISWQLVWEKKHILLLCSMLHESGYP